MSPSKKDRNHQSQNGKSFPTQPTGRLGSAGFAMAISEALRREFGSRGSAVKTLVALTAVNERAAKNWFDGRNGPSGEFLMLLCQHSDHVLETVLVLSGRSELVTAKKLVDARVKLQQILQMIDELEASGSQ